MKIIIHRGAGEIGGNCIEFATEQSRILFDYGYPLTGTSDKLKLDLKLFDGIILSHAHLDHYGMIMDDASGITIFCEKTTERLINTTLIFSGKQLVKNKVIHFKDGIGFYIKDILITPYLVDHSDPMSFAFLVEANGKKIIYTGDFRANGRKSRLYYKFINNARLMNPDLILSEGTAIKRKKSEFIKETDIENKLSQIFKEQTDPSFIIASSQNIDRMVSVYKACVKSDKIFVIDFYTAWILHIMQDVSLHIPHHSWSDISVIHNFSGRHYEIIKNNPVFFGDFLANLYQNNTRIRLEHHSDISKFVFKLSGYHAAKVLKHFCINKPNIIYSQWHGYISTDKILHTLSDIYGFIHCHTSGHATAEEIKNMLSTLNPKCVIPIHTEANDIFLKLSDKVKIFNNGDIISSEKLEVKSCH